MITASSGGALLWFQAERTIPNPAILKGISGGGEMTLEARIRAADLLGWPSDFAAWARLIGLLLRHLPELPVAVLLHVTSIFEVWQNALCDLENPVSKALLANVECWLLSLEDRWVVQRNYRTPPTGVDYVDQWRDLPGGQEAFASDLRRMLLRSARAEPELVRRYLSRLGSRRELLGHVIEGILALSPLLATTHPLTWSI